MTKFDKSAAIARYGDVARMLCEAMGTDPNVSMTHIDHVFECLSCVAPRWKHVAYRLHVDDMVAEAKRT